MRRLLLLASVVACPVACTAGPSDRPSGERRPLSAACDALDGTRCLLPWPSSTFTVADPSTRTGLRLAVSRSSLPAVDDPSALNRLDGFSVATALAVGFPAKLDPALAGPKQSSAVRLLDADAQEVPLRLHVVADGASEAELLIAYPLRPLAYDHDYVAVVLDEVRPAAGGSFAAPRSVEVALQRAPAESPEERALAAYHAPTRALLARAGVDPARVLRVWDFTTRSAEGLSAPLSAMRAKALAVVQASGLEIALDSAAPRAGGGLELRGRVGGLPSFLTDAKLLSLGADGLPAETGAREVPFRVVLPVGDGPLPIVVFGHGTGSDVNDDDLDDVFVGTGAAKLNLEFEGWTRGSVPSTFLDFAATLSGSERSTARLAQSLVDASALEHALGAQLGAVLAAPTLMGMSNPAAGRPVDLERIGYFGSSLGGTLGYAHAQAEPAIRGAVLNVPGAGCTQFLLHAEQWKQLDAVFAELNPSAVDRALALVMAQTSWDLVDGAAWSALPGATPKPLLIQESIGDPVMPNLGSELVAASARAVAIGHPIEPVLGVGAQAEALGIPALTQFRVPASVTDSGAIHAFVTKETPAGVAAREQLSAFFSSLWAGAPRVIEPPSCQGRAAGCDFSDGP